MEGRFNAKVENHFVTEVGEKQTPAVRITFTADELTEPVSANLWLSEAAFPYTMKTLTEVLGWTGDDFEELNAEPPVLAGRLVSLVLADEEYQGKTRTVVKYINKIGGGKKAEPEKISALKGKLLAYRKAKPAAPVSDGLNF
jgi:hypothetical protein